MRCSVLIKNHVLQIFDSYRDGKPPSGIFDDEETVRRNLLIALS